MASAQLSNWNSINQYNAYRNQDKIDAHTKIYIYFWAPTAKQEYDFFFNFNFSVEEILVSFH